MSAGTIQVTRVKQLLYDIEQTKDHKGMVNPCLEIHMVINTRPGISVHFKEIPQLSSLHFSVCS